jgi:hypothetical protein
MHESDIVHAPRPWVNVAAFCQTSIREHGSGNLSIIKVNDGMTLVGVTKEMQPTPVQLTMVLILKAGDMQGQYSVKVRCVSPTGTETTGPDIPHFFEGGTRGIQTVLPIGMIATEPGDYWFDVLLEDEILTRVPLRVLYQQVPIPPGMAGQIGPGM